MTVGVSDAEPVAYYIILMLSQRCSEEIVSSHESVGDLYSAITCHEIWLCTQCASALATWV